MTASAKNSRSRKKKAAAPGTRPTKPAEPVKQDRLQYMLFNASEQRLDKWRNLSTTAAALSKEHLEQVARHNDLLAECRAKLEELGPLESYWAFPGKHLFEDIQSLLNTGHYGSFALKVDHVFQVLKTGSYRRRQEVWAIPEQTTEDLIAEVPDYTSRRELATPYFEVLVVDSHLSPQQQSQARNEIRTFRRLLTAST